jgi:hypothetical protein
MKSSTKILGIIVMMIIIGLLLVGCSESSKISNLSGIWKQVNSNSEDSYQEAKISESVIEIFWITNGGETRSLYWAGTYVAPDDKVDTYKWDSINDYEKTNSALLASGDEKKTIGYENGQLYYEVSAFGTTTTVKLEIVK